jgi:uncharacterized protein YkwD
MLSSAVVIGALAALANAVPVQERAVTVYDITDVYTTVYEDAPAAESTSSTTSTRNWWFHKHGSSAAAVTTAVVTPTPQAAPTTFTTAAEVPTTSAPVVPAYTSMPAYSSPVSSYAPVASAGSSYSALIVAHHNAHRANHSAPALAWDDATAATALEIANSCNYAHNT